MARSRPRRAFRAWLARNGTITYDELRQFAREWMDDLTAGSTHERDIAAIMLDGIERKVLPEARTLHRALVNRLRWERPCTRAEPQDLAVASVGIGHVKAIDWLMQWLERSPQLGARSLMRLRSGFARRLTTRDECLIAAKLLAAHRARVDKSAADEFDWLLDELAYRAEILAD